jgi:hypothetical protein
VDVDVLGQVFGRFLLVGFAHGVERALSHAMTSAFEVTVFSSSRLKSAGTLGPANASRAKLAVTMCTP